MFYSIKTCFKTHFDTICYVEGSLWSWNCSGIVRDECGVKTLNNEEFN